MLPPTASTHDNTVDVEAEQWVIQSIMLAPEAADQAFIMLGEQDFYDPRNRTLWKHIKRLHESGKPTDPNLLIGSLRDDTDCTGKAAFDSIGGYEYLGLLLEASTLPHHVRYYAERVRKASLLRELKLVSTRIMHDVNEHDGESDIEELVSKCEQRLFDVTDKSLGKQATTLSFKETIFQALERIDARRGQGYGDGLMSGIDELDKMTGGFRPGELIVIGARPGCGKTTLGLSFAEHMSLNENANIVFSSLEMSAIEIADRLLASSSEINLNRIRSGCITQLERQALVDAAGRLSHASLFFDDAPSRTVAQIGSFARLVNRRHKGLGCVIVDYIQLITPEGTRDSRQEQVAKISRRLKTLARELKVPIVVLAQLNRQADEPSKPPRLSQLRESGAIEQDADVVMFIHRPEGPKNDQEVRDAEEAEIHVAKQRNGPTGIVKVKFYRRWCRFGNVATSWQERRDASFDHWNNS